MKNYSKYLGRDFDLGANDCYGLIRDFYSEELNISLTNYARPEGFWNHDDLNLYEDNIRKEGFKRIDFEDIKNLQFGDIILTAIGTVNPCHGLIYLGEGQVLHHFTSKKSAINPYNGMWRNATMSAYRHPKVVQDNTIQLKELIDDNRVKNFIDVQKRRI